MKKRPVLRFFLLYFLMLLLQQTISISDSLLVGNILGTAQFAAVDASAALLRLPLAFAAGLSAGLIIVLSQALGEQKSTGSIALTGVLLCALCGIVLAAVGVLCAAPLLAFYEVPSNLLQASTQYYSLRLLGVPFLLTFNGCVGILYAKKKTAKPLILLLFSFLLNIVLTYLFVSVLKKATTGAAVATVISQVLQCGIGVYLCFRDGEFVAIPRAQCKPLCASLLKTGLPIAFQSVIFAITNTLLYRFINRLGAQPLAVWGLCGKLDMPFWIVLDAACTTLTTFCAGYFGSRQISKLRQLLRKGGTACLLSEMLICVLLWFLSPLVGTWILQDSSVVFAAVVLLHLILLFYLPYAVSDLVSAALRACGKTVLPFLFVLLQCGARLSALFFMQPTQLKDIALCYILSLVLYSLCAVPGYVILRKSFYSVKNRS